MRINKRSHLSIAKSVYGMYKTLLRLNLSSPAVGIGSTSLWIDWMLEVMDIRFAKYGEEV